MSDKEEYERRFDGPAQSGLVEFRALVTPSQHETLTAVLRDLPKVVKPEKICPVCNDDGYKMTMDGPIVCNACQHPDGKYYHGKASPGLVKPEKVKTDLPYAYTYGNGNHCGDKASYYCHHCDLDLHGQEVRIVGAGSLYASGECAPCPRCNNENDIDRDLGEWD